jgi:hypothetical protein
VDQQAPLYPEEKHVVNTQPKFLQVLAHIVSYVFHPVLFPLAMTIVLSRLDNQFYGVPDKQLKLWFLSIGITAVFFPLFSIAIMKPLGFINSYLMPTAKERTIPLMTSMIFYFWVTHVFNTISGPPLSLKVLLLGNFWGIIAVFMANIFTKISMHTTVAGAMVGIMLVLLWNGHVNMAIPLLVSIIIAGIVGTARMILGAHQRGDIWLGYIIGIAVQLGAYVYMR